MRVSVVHMFGVAGRAYCGRELDLVPWAMVPADVTCANCLRVIARKMSIAGRRLG